MFFTVSILSVACQSETSEAIILKAVASRPGNEPETDRMWRFNTVLLVARFLSRPLFQHHTFSDLDLSPSFLSLLLFIHLLKIQNDDAAA